MLYEFPEIRRYVKPERVIDLIKILDFILYSVKDFLVVLTSVYSSVFLLGGKFRKNIPALIILPAVILINSAFGAFFFTGTEEDRLMILDIVSSTVFFLSVGIFVKDIKPSKKIWFSLMCICTMEMFFSLFAPYVPAHLFVEAIIYICLYSVMLAVMLFNIRNLSVNPLPKVFDSIPKYIFIAILFFEMTGYYKSYGESYVWYNILYIISTICVVLCVLFFIIKIFSLTYQQNEILRQFNEQRIYSEKMLKGDENLRRFRHDYRNHMIVINALLEDGSTDRAREYISAMNADINGVLKKISTGNFVADAIINNKSVIAASDGNKIEFDGQFPEKGIADEDICTILSNALDNALEATNKIDGECIISVEAAVRNRNFLLSISNPVSEKVKIGKNNTVKTTKKNRSEHGIGTKNIKRVADKYKGNMLLSCENNVFCFEIRLCLPES